MESGQRLRTKFTRSQVCCSFRVSLNGGIWLPAPSRMLRKSSPSVVPSLYPLGSVRFVASAMTASSALPSSPWQPVQFWRKRRFPLSIDVFEYGGGLVRAFASEALSGSGTAAKDTDVMITPPDSSSARRADFPKCNLNCVPYDDMTTKPCRGERPGQP